jgi:hypothetical protein
MRAFFVRYSCAMKGCIKAREHQRRGHLCAQRISVPLTLIWTLPFESLLLRSTIALLLMHQTTLVRTQCTPRRPSQSKTTKWVRQKSGQSLLPSCLYHLGTDSRDNEPIWVKGDVSYSVAAPEMKIWSPIVAYGPTTLRYYFMDGNSIQHIKVKKIIIEWALYAWVRFEEVFEPSISDIRITFDDNKRSSSWVSSRSPF